MRKEYKWADVAHHYAKSNLSIMVGQFDHGPEMGMIFSKGLHENCEWAEHGMWCQVENGAFVSEWGSHTPILRHIEDLVPYSFDRDPSDEEFATADSIWQELWDIVFPESTQDKNADVFESRRGDMWMLRRGSERLLLNEFGDMYASDVNGVRPFNGAAVTHVLTREGFDVFGLIKSRQAIRKPIPKP